MSAEALFVDGANGVGDALRAGDRNLALLQGALVLVLALVIAAFSSRRAVSRRARAIVIGALAIAGTIPGAHAMIFVRADRPTQIARTAHESIRLHDAIRDFARNRGCARVVRDACRACAPRVRLAIADLRCDDPAEIILEDDAFTGRCVRENERLLRCGTSR